MSATETEESQSGFDDGGQGPGAPTPLTVLEVKITSHDFSIHPHVNCRESPAYQQETSSS